jgi:hypothetical protein
MFVVIGIRKIDGQVIELFMDFEMESAEACFNMYNSSKEARGFSSVHLLKEVV